MQLPDDFEAIFRRIKRRCEAARNAGGIPRWEVLDNIRTIPEGWVFDYCVDYWLPPNVVILDAAS